MEIDLVGSSQPRTADDRGRSTGLPPNDRLRRSLAATSVVSMNWSGSSALFHPRLEVGLPIARGLAAGSAARQSAGGPFRVKTERTPTRPGADAPRWHDGRANERTLGVSPVRGRSRPRKGEGRATAVRRRVYRTARRKPAIGHAPAVLDTGAQVFGGWRAVHAATASSQTATSVVIEKQEGSGSG